MTTSSLTRGLDIPEHLAKVSVASVTMRIVGLLYKTHIPNDHPQPYRQRFTNIPLVPPTPRRHITQHTKNELSLHVLGSLGPGPNMDQFSRKKNKSH